METTKMRVRCTFTDDILGTTSANPEIHSEFIASKAPDARNRNEELTHLIERDGLDEALDKSMTIFPMDENGRPFMWDYQIRGFFKDSCGLLRKNNPKSLSKKLTAYKRAIDGGIFITDRMNFFEVKGEMGECQRPLRAQTAQGERVSLATSETIPAGSTLEFTVEVFDESYLPTIREWMDYGSWHGMGQWRNSGRGRFRWEELDEDGNVIGGNLR